MRRILALFTVFLLAATSFTVLAQGFPSAQPALDFIEKHPDDTAVLCYSPGAESSGFAHNADEPFPLASTYKVVILAEMARQIDMGLINPDEEVALADVNVYWLPLTDGGAHQLWLDTIPADQETVTLSEVANAMIAYSSNAAPDYLLSRLGYDGFPELFEQLGLENTDLPAGTYLGFFLAYDNHETGPVDLEALDSEILTAERQRLEQLYLTDAEWREAEQVYHEEKLASLTAAPDKAAVEIQRQIAYLETYDAHGSARDMLTIMQAAYSDSIFSAEARQFMQSKLNWLMDINPVNRDTYSDIGTKGGSLPSILTSIWYVTPLDGESITLAVFYRNVPLDLWSEWAETRDYQGLEIRAVAGGEGCAIFADLR